MTITIEGKITQGVIIERTDESGKTRLFPIDDLPDNFNKETDQLVAIIEASGEVVRKIPLGVSERIHQD